MRNFTISTIHSTLQFYIAVTLTFDLSILYFLSRSNIE